MRETEILRDFLLDCFKRLPNLKPHEIMVLVPDMAKYAPYLDAVFKNLPPDEPGYFFATIADIRQRYGVESGALAGFLKIASGRFTVMEVLALLEVPAVFAKFGISDDEMPLLRNWIRGTNIKWGIDADFRKETLGVEFDANSWRAGLARLQASFAFGSLGDDAVPVFADGASGDIAVSAMVPEASAALLGKFSEFMEELFALRERLLEAGVARNAEYWRDFALDVIRLFFSDEEPHTAAVQGLRDSVCRALIAPPGMEFSRVVFEYLLAAEFDRTVSTGGFLRGGVTFCEMKALRSLPARVICLLGMNEGDFPRLSFRDSLDLIGQGGARLGDHSLRADDRAQFLESLISARDVFYLSYLGQDIKDNCELPPSVLVSELLDYLVRYDYLPPCGFKSIGDFVQLKHPLHPFSRRYFDGSEPNLHSYSQKNLVAAKKNAERAPDARRIFCQVTLPPPSFDDGILPLSSLIEFYKNPAKYFLRHRLNVNPEVSAESEFDASEPMDVKAFEIYQIKQDLLDVMLSGDEKQISAKRRALCCSGDLPPCSLGQAQLAEVCATARSVADKIAHITKNTVMALGAKENFVVDYVLPPENIISQLPITLEGYFPRIFIADGGATLVLGRCAKIKEKDRTAAQISRLAANLGETPVAAKLVGEDGVEDYPACGKEAARAALQVLLDYYVIGMTRPLPFFPVASQEYCGRIVKNNDMDEALRAAQTVWTGDEYRGAGEADDRCIQLCFNGVFPDVDEFVEISQKVCAALNGEVE
jgi:exodeoxyribonuclease V gamma subunit